MIDKIIKGIGFIAIVTFLLFGLSGCGTTNAADAVEKPEAPEPEAQAREVRVAEALSGDVEEIITRTSTIISPNTVDLLPKISGQVVYLDAEEGARVKSGQVIARIDDSQLRIDLERSKATLDKARHDLDLAQRQFDAAVIGKEELLQAKHDADQAERNYQSAVIELNKTEVISPINGIITARHISRGDTVFVSTPIVTITDPSRLEAEILIPQDQIDRVAVNDRVVFFPNGDAERPFYGAVERISPVIETETGTVKVTALVQSGQPNVLPGQFVKVNIVTGVQEDVVLVPRTAIVFENAMSVIYKVEGGMAHRVTVDLGYPSADMIQVSGEISKGDSVVVSGMTGLDDMMKVTVLPPLSEQFVQAED